MDQRNLISSMVFFLLGAVALVLSLGLGIGSLNNPQSGFMPFWTSLLIIIFSLILFGAAYADKSIAVRWKHIWHGLHWQKSVLVVISLAVYIVVLPWAGYLIATGILMIVVFWSSSLRIRPAVLYAVLSVGVSYGLFHYILQTPLPRGLWGF